MTLYDDLINRREKLSLVGLGYVGLPIAVAFGKHIDVIGFDNNSKKIEKYLAGQDPTNEVGDLAIQETKVHFTNDPNELESAKFHIVAVPTPVQADKTPDLTPVISASEMLGKHLVKGSIVVYESTVFPGVTEEICVPILEKESGLKCGEDFKVGYSPERINPGDKVHRLETIVKIVSGMDKDSLDIIAKTYELVIEAGVHRAKSIQVAEAAKVIENSQRDINIAFVNELSMIFNRLGIDTQAVLQAAGTKWNFLDFKPGLVGGHCIGVDPYYLTYRAEQFGYHSQIILSGRRINDQMSHYVSENVIKQLIMANKKVKGARVGLFGFTFKENCPDTRNTRLVEIYDQLRAYGIEPLIYDPVADIYEMEEEYGIQMATEEAMCNLDAIILGVAHDIFKEQDKSYWLERLSDDTENVIIDVKNILVGETLPENIHYWHL